MAGLLTYLVPGLGQLYNGELKKGLIFSVLFSFWSTLISNGSLAILNGTYARADMLLLLLFVAVSFGAILYFIIDAIRGARSKGSAYILKRYNRWYLYLLIIIISQGIDMYTGRTVKDLLVAPFKIPTASMRPALMPGDFLLVNKIAYRQRQPQHGDIVLFIRNGNEFHIKRVMGVPGDTLEIIDKKVYINSAAAHDPWKQHVDEEMLPASESPRDAMQSMLISPGCYFVLGDNRDNSLDSRYYGVIPREQIIGKASFIYWSWSKKFPFIRFSRIGSPL